MTVTRYQNFPLKDDLSILQSKMAISSKACCWQTAEGECYVKLAKDLRAAFNLELPKGTWLQVVGEKTLDLKTGEVKLKASRVMAGGTGDKGDRGTGGQGGQGGQVRKLLY